MALGAATLTFKDVLLSNPAAYGLTSWVGSWVQPLNGTLSVNAGFLANSCGHSEYGSYGAGIHLGLDLFAVSGASVYAIGNGTVFDVQSGWPGTAVFVNHTAADGTQFSAVYAHINSSLEAGSNLTAGDVVGTVLNQEDETHFHLGIRNILSSSGQNGNLPCGTWPPNTNGYVDPITYLTAHPALLTIKRSLNVTTRFIKIGSGDGAGGLGSVVALAGDVGYPCAGNWQEYVRNPANGSKEDRAASEFKAHGDAVWIPAAQWDALRKLYTEGGPSITSPTVTLSAADHALLQEISDKLTAPPA